MAFSDDIFLPDNLCEICGAELSAEVVIQEFADGSIARLCGECAAGAALQREGEGFKFPDDSIADAGDITAVVAPEAAALFAADAPAQAPVVEAPVVAPAVAAPASAISQDMLEKTRELMTPLVDLLALQADMQGALQRLATSLQTFATGVMTENVDKTATIESRVQALEAELERTRARLRETEALLVAGSAGAPAAVAAPAPPAATPAAPAPAAEEAAPPLAAEEAVIPAVAEEPQAAAEDLPAVATPAPAEGSLWDFEATVDSTAESFLASASEYVLTDSGSAAEQVPAAELPAAADELPLGATQPYSAADLEATMVAAPVFAPPPAAAPSAPAPVAPPSGPPTGEPHGKAGFQLVEVQIAQRYFNESQFTNRVRDVRRSLGKPKANVTKLIGPDPRALITISWDIIWYQYLVDLRRDIPIDQRVVLHREGMDLEELTPPFREKNASIDDEGRLDASELEVKLLSDPSTLITEMSVEDERALEDATEEIWDQKTAPEFKWDD